MALYASQVTAQDVFWGAPNQIADAPLGVGIQRLSDGRLYDVDASVWSARILPVRLQAEYRSTYPREIQNRSLWSGVGMAGSLGLGGSARIGPLTVALQPSLQASRNRDFPTSGSPWPGYSPFADPWSRYQIDTPQRMGTDPVHDVSWGQSFAEVDLGWLRSGVSTENIHLGPAQRYPLFFDTNAPGFLHAYAEVSGGISGVGQASAELVFGRLLESEFFDAVQANDRNEISVLTVTLSPSALSGLSLGASLSVRGPPRADENRLERAFKAPLLPFRGNAPDRIEDGMFRIAGEWRIPGRATRLYLEWIRGDFFENAEDFITEPEHASALVGGVRTAWNSHGERIAWHMAVEAAATTGSNTLQGFRGVGTGGIASGLYRNGVSPQGHTHRGQPLATYIGPGSKAVFGQIGAGSERIRFRLTAEHALRDLDSYWFQVRPALPEASPDREVSLSVGTTMIEGDAVRGMVQLSADLGYSRRRNRSMIPFWEGNSGSATNEGNAWVDVVLRWTPPSRDVRGGG